MINCKLCAEEITFDDDHVSERTGKKIPLDAKPKGGSSVHNSKEMCFSVKNAEDFANGKFEELVELGRRGLSGTTPSLKKLLQPIAEDPNISLLKKERGYLDPSKISYSQGSGYQ